VGERDPRSAMMMIHRPPQSPNSRSVEVNEQAPIEQSRVRLLFVIRSLDHGGAERQLIALAKGLDKDRFAVSVVTFYDGGALRSEIEGIEGVQLLSLQKRGRWDWLRCLRIFDRVIRELKPQIVHGYLGAANELGLLARARTDARVVWGLRGSQTDLSRYDWVYSWSYRAGAWLSRFADLIIVNSYAGKTDNIAGGYAGERMLVIHNGIDTQRFRPNTAARNMTRRKWGVGENDLLIGLVARLDPMKGHSNFLQAAALLSKERDDVRFVCIGNGPAAYKRELQSLASGLGLCDRLHWTHAHNDMVAAYNALDLAASASDCGEGFSNAIGEAMACGTPCVVTDVGDSARIIGNPEQVVPPRDPQALAAAWQRILTLEPTQRAMLSQSSRERIKREFSLQQLVDKTECTLLRLLKVQAKTRRVITQSRT
jgi:glycosyltransferase involved in cell wall biosynthesis